MSLIAKCSDIKFTESTILYKFLFPVNVSIPFMLRYSNAEYIKCLHNAVYETLSDLGLLVIC